jgi:hypothetical protein
VNLYQLFSAQLTVLQNDRGGERPEVQELFHGTGSKEPHFIFNGQEGFDMRFCKAGMWGTASYFAVDAGYSNADKYCFKNERGERELLIADVITGRTIELQPDASLSMPPELPATAPGVIQRYDSVTGVGGGGGSSRIFMIYRHDRAYPKFRLTYVTDQDGQPSRHVSPGQPSRHVSPTGSPVQVAAVAAVDKFALYLRPHLALGTARWAAGWQAAAQQQQLWGGLHVTLCSFAPKLSSGVRGHHGGSLIGTLQQLQVGVQAGAGGAPNRWQLAAQHGTIIWHRRGHLIFISLPTACPGTLAAVSSVVLGAGMVNARRCQDLHLTLGDVRTLQQAQQLPGGAVFPADGASQPLPPELVADLYEAHWGVSIAKLAGGNPPAKDNEALPI